MLNVTPRISSKGIFLRMVEQLLSSQSTQISLILGYFSHNLSTICAILIPTPKDRVPLQASKRCKVLTAQNQIDLQMYLFSMSFRKKVIETSVSSFSPMSCSMKGMRFVRSPSTVMEGGRLSADMTLLMFMKNWLYYELRKEQGSSLIMLQSLRFYSYSCLPLSFNCCNFLMFTFQPVLGTLPFKQIQRPASRGPYNCRYLNNFNCYSMMVAGEVQSLSSFTAQSSLSLYCPVGVMMRSLWLISLSASQISSRERVSLLSLRMNLAAAQISWRVYSSTRVCSIA